MMKILFTAKMMGTYNKAFEKVVADKMAGTVTSAMGFIYDEKLDFSVPCTVLKTDVREVSLHPTLPIVAVFRKCQSDGTYNEITMISQSIPVDALRTMKGLDEKVDFTNLSFNDSCKPFQQVGATSAKTLA